MSITHAPELNGGTLTSWLPLTTAWPSDPLCSTAIYSQLGSGGKAIAYDPFYGSLIDRSLTCHPKAVSVWWKQGETSSLQTVQSLGPFECAGDYSTAVTSKVDKTSTFVACCPSNYDFQFSTNFGKLGQCVSPMSAGQTLTYMSIVSNDNAEFRAATTTMQSRTLVYAVQVNGYIFADAVETESVASRSNGNDHHSTTLLTTGTGAGASTPNPINLENSSSRVPTSINSTPDLSNGAKIGIGIGVWFGVLGLVALGLAIFFIRKHRQQQVYSTNPHTTDKHVQAAPWYGAGEVFSPNPKYGSFTHQTQPVGPEKGGAPGSGSQEATSEIGSGHQDRVFEMSGEGRLR